MGTRPGNMSQNDPQTTSLLTSLKKSATPNQNNFFSSAD